VSAREWPLWDGKETVASYAARVKLPATKAIDLGNNLTLELVLIPPGKFMMGSQDLAQSYGTIEEAIGMMILGAILTVVLFVLLRMNYRKNQRRHFSLGWLVLLTFTVGLFFGGIARGYAVGVQAHELKKHVVLGLAYNEFPAHSVTISKPFYMGKYSVTYEQSDIVLRTNMGQYMNPKHVAVGNSSWNMAVDFCRKIKGYLPTEAQWEYACRAGTTTRFYTGDKESDLDRAGWYYLNTRNRNECVVGEKVANAFGLFDMHGNVSQWCEDWFGEYKGESQVDPKGPLSGTRRVLRGGSYWTMGTDCRSASRSCESTDGENRIFGFRVCMPVEE